MATAIQERRRFPRSEAAVRFAINLLRPQGLIAVNSVNFSEGGLCLRLEEALDVRSLVRLQVTPARSNAARGSRCLECTARVAWVVQRLDLRDTPPFLYDIGIEFVDPPAVLRRLIARGAGLTALKTHAVRAKTLESAVVHGRCFIPRLERESNHPPRWHLIVSVGGVPCFSARYPSDRAAMLAWAQFKRRQARR